MTEKQLRDDIILKMLDYRDEENVDIDKFCEAKKIKFSSDIQKERIFEDLSDKGYIKYSLYINHNGHFTLTSEGIDYAEEL